MNYFGSHALAVSTHSAVILAFDNTVILRKICDYLPLPSVLKLSTMNWSMREWILFYYQCRRFNLPDSTRVSFPLYMEAMNIARNLKNLSLAIVTGADFSKVAGEYCESDSSPIEVTSARRSEISRSATLHDIRTRVSHGGKAFGLLPGPEPERALLVTRGESYTITNIKGCLSVFDDFFHMADAGIKNRVAYMMRHVNWTTKENPIISLYIATPNGWKLVGTRTFEGTLVWHCDSYFAIETLHINPDIDPAQKVKSLLSYNVLDFLRNDSSYRLLNIEHTKVVYGIDSVDIYPQSGSLSTHITEENERLLIRRGESAIGLDEDGDFSAVQCALDYSLDNRSDSHNNPEQDQFRESEIQLTKPAIVSHSFAYLPDDLQERIRRFKRIVCAYGPPMAASDLISTDLFQSILQSENLPHNPNSFSDYCPGITACGFIEFGKCIPSNDSPEVVAAEVSPYYLTRFGNHVYLIAFYKHGAHETAYKILAEEGAKIFYAWTYHHYNEPQVPGLPHREIWVYNLEINEPPQWSPEIDLQTRYGHNGGGYLMPRRMPQNRWGSTTVSVPPQPRYGYDPDPGSDLDQLFSN